MNLSPNGKKLIKGFEGCRLKAYKCAAGVWTIGYGHTNKVRPDDVITQQEADQLFDNDIIIYCSNVEKLVKVPLEQNQFDALVSFTYNIGINAFKSSTLLKLLNSGKYNEASQEFLRWNKAGGRVLEGLTRRRKEEKRLFDS